MTLLHRARVLAQRFGIDVARYPASWSGPQLVQLMETFGIDVVLDVGAHIGGYGSTLRRCGYRGRIVSFEPLSGPRAELCRAAARDDAWTVLPYALGDQDGTTEVNVAGNSGASSSVLPMLSRHRTAAPHASYTGKRQHAEVRRLDGLWEQIVSPGDRVFLKVDVQGYEAHVLRGMGDFADRISGMQTETSLVPLYEGGLLFGDALALAQSELGLTLMAVMPGFTDPVNGQMLQCDLVLFREHAREREMSAV